MYKTANVLKYFTLIMLCRYPPPILDSTGHACDFSENGQKKGKMLR